MTLLFLFSCRVLVDVGITDNRLPPPGTTPDAGPDGGVVLPDDSIPDEFAERPRFFWEQIEKSDSTYSFAITDNNNNGRWTDSLRWLPVGPFVQISPDDTLATRDYARTQATGSGITSLNTLTGATQTFATGTSGSDFNISSSVSTHTFNLPDAGASARGAVTTGTQTFAGNKTFTGDIFVNSATPDILHEDTGVTWSANQLTAFGNLQNEIYRQTAASTSDGGMDLRGYSKAAAAASKGIHLKAYVENEPSSATGAIVMEAFKHNGSGGLTAVANSSVLWALYNNGSRQAYIDGDGDIIFNSRILTGGGTAASPAWTFSAGPFDTNTGVYRAAEDQLGFSTGGTNRMTLTTTGLNLSTQAVFWNQSAEPTGIEGGVFYDTDDNWFKGYNGSAWTLFPSSSIYTANGTIGENRTVTVDGFTLAVSGTTATPLTSTATTSYAIQGQNSSTSLGAVRAVKVVSTTSAGVTGNVTSVQTTGTAAAGFGNYDDTYVEIASGSAPLAMRQAVIYTDAGATYDAKFELSLADNGATAEVLELTSGYVQFSAGASVIRFGQDVSTTVEIIVGSGDPEGAQAAAVGSLFLRTDGGSGTTLYVKESGTGNTGWAAK